MNDDDDYNITYSGCCMLLIIEQNERKKYSHEKYMLLKINACWIFLLIFFLHTSMYFYRKKA